MARLSARKKVYGFVLILFVLTAGAHLVYEHLLSEKSVEAASDPASSAEKEDKDAVPVELAEVTLGEISSYLTATANLRPLREVDVMSQAEGLVTRLHVEEGDVVSPGQVLCQLDEAQLQIQLQTAKQKLAQARLQEEKSRVRQQKAASQIRNSREELDRYEKLYAEKLVSEREVAQLRYRLDELLHDERVSSHEIAELTHRVEELEAEIEEVRLRLSQTRVKAPFAGVITERLVEQGKTVRNLDRLFKLSSFKSLFADVYLSEKEARAVEEDQRANVVLGVDSEIHETGRVARISPVVDQSTGTVKVTVELDGQTASLKPGAFVRVEIETDARSETSLVPKRALLDEDGRRYVFVAEGDTVRRIEVQPGYESNGQTEILEGLKAGDQVVVAGQGNLKEGSRIKVSQDS